MPSGGFAHKPPAWLSMSPRDFKLASTETDRLRDEYIRLGKKYGMSSPLTRAARKAYEDARGRPIEGER